MVTSNKGSWPLIWGTVYNSKVDGARSNLTRNEQGLKPRADFFISGGWGRQCPNSNVCKLLELFITSRARKLIFGLHVNIDKANSRRYDVTQ